MGSYECNEFRNYMGKAERDKAVQTLKGIFEGILIDDQINHDEISELQNWIIVNESLCKFKPFDELIEVIGNAVEDDILTEDEVQDIQWVIDKFSNEGEYFKLSTLQIQRLEGMCHGILADDKVTDEEILNLNEWLSDNDFLLKGTYPYEEIRSIIIGILRDGIIDESEKLMLKAFLVEFVDCKVSLNLNQAELEELRKLYSLEGICATDPRITIEGNLFCFTGKSSRGTRNDIEHLIQEHGGRTKSNVVRDTNYLIVGTEGNPCWAYSCYGRKVEAAVALRKEGLPIQIINENDFWKLF